MSGASGASVSLVEATLSDLAAALEAGRTTSVELVAGYLNRIARYDHHGLALNAVPVLNSEAFAEARASDERRARGEALGPLDGIPYTAKDSYQVRGLTVAAGSPAFEHLVAGADAFAIERLRAAGAICLGLTNMPPMANGGMQRGVYGRAESPYNRDFLAAAYLSGSSNGSGVATAASLCAFGLGEETWSSGRSPASNNALVAYTPSRGVISVRGNWPLTPTMDVVVPHTRTVDDLLALLDVLVVDDPDTRGDFWRSQPWVELPPASAMRPGPPESSGSFSTGVPDPDALRGRRLGVPRMFLGRDRDQAWAIVPRLSMLELFDRARADLEAQGAEVVEVDFPALSNYERDRPGARNGVDRGILPARFFDAEMWDLTTWAWNDFLAMNGDPALDRLADVDGSLIFPTPTGAIADHVRGAFDEYNLDLAEYPVRAARPGVESGLVERFEDIPDLADGVRGLEELRRLDLESWLDEQGLDALVFPTAVDVGRADADVNPASHERAMANGVWVSTGNTMIRHYGVPTVTVTMGLLADLRMPVGLTFAGRAYDDIALLRSAWAYERASRRRVLPPSMPELAPLARVGRAAASGAAPRLAFSVAVEPDASGGTVRIRIEGETDAPLLQLFVDGAAAAVERDGTRFMATAAVPAAEFERRHSEWRDPYGALVVVVATAAGGASTGAFRAVGGV
ncbi:amidase [Agromyces intestinalis]|uniref:Amidase n=1 Tax=Agromyces intestinalis TaxID=2592652 RepID=A0A5C1YDW8_9MICO|nr:amidase [Agromyces intestinalis]